MSEQNVPEIPSVIRYWRTCEDGIHCMEPAPEGKGDWIRYSDYLALTEQNRQLRAKLAEAQENIAEYVAYLPASRVIAEENVKLKEKLAAMEAPVTELERLREALDRIISFGEDEGNDDAGMMATEMYNVATAARAAKEQP
jgi:hypothetical protein